jgi:hypothetical protein
MEVGDIDMALGEAGTPTGPAESLSANVERVNGGLGFGQLQPHSGLGFLNEENPLGRNAAILRIQGRPVSLQSAPARYTIVILAKLFSFHGCDSYVNGYSAN